MRTFQNGCIIKGVVITPPVKIAYLYYNYWPGKQPVHVIDVVTDWSYALVGFLVSTLFCGSPGQS